MAYRNDVLVGLGDSQHGHAELDWAAREARIRHTGLRLVRAYHLSQAASSWDPMTERLFRADVRHAAQRRVDAALDYVHHAWPGVAAAGRIVEGLASEVLCSEAADAAVTVLGARHHGPLGATMLGSVSTVVAASAPGPVVVAARLPGDPAADPLVVAGIDCSDRTDDVLEFSFDYASRHGRGLKAVFCWHPDLLAGMRWRLPPAAPGWTERWLSEAVAGWQEKYPDVPVRRAVVREFPVTGLVAESLSQELLVVGDRPRHARVAALFGSVVQGVLHRATCPVAIVHPRADDG